MQIVFGLAAVLVGGIVAFQNCAKIKYRVPGKAKNLSLSTACRPGSTATCPVPNGQGQMTCLANGSGYGPCVIVSCNQPYFLHNNQCFSEMPKPTRAGTCEPGAMMSCSEGVGSGFQTCDGNIHRWGPCQFNSCQHGFTLQNGQCLPDSVQEPIEDTE